jgi:transcriptional/translational regulatory protein YebC/TACO1
LLENKGSQLRHYFISSIDVVTTPEDFFTVKDALADSGLKSSHAEVTMEPANRVELNLGDAEKFMKLIERLEDLDDTQEVYHNADISERNYHFLFQDN